MFVAHAKVNNAQIIGNLSEDCLLCSLLALLLFSLGCFFLRERIYHKSIFWRRVFASLWIEFQFFRDYDSSRDGSDALWTVVLVEAGLYRLHFEHLQHLVSLDAILGHGFQVGGHLKVWQAFNWGCSLRSARFLWHRL